MAKKILFGSLAAGLLALAITLAACEGPVSPDQQIWVFQNKSNPGPGGAVPYGDFVLPLNNLDMVIPYINAHPDGYAPGKPVNLKLQIDLGTMTSITSNWQSLLGAIEAAGKYVALDLSDCSMNGNVFNPDYRIDTGKAKIVSMVLPDVPLYIQGGVDFSSTGINGPFLHFTKLTEVEVRNITSISGYSFPGCTNLERISFPATTSIYNNPFYGCTVLTFSVIGNGVLSTILNGKALVRNNTELISYPSIGSHITMDNITSISDYAFNGYTSLVNVELEFPLVTYIGNNAFENCTNLYWMDFPLVEYIGSYAFHNCGFPIVDFPLVKNIGNQAFYECENLQGANFPMAETIGYRAFGDCRNLTIVNLPLVKTIGEMAFASCSILASVSFPLAKTIGFGAFWYTSLTSVSLPMAETIDGSAFASTGATALTITLGNSAPSLQIGIFINNPPKTVTVQVPAGATGYGAIPATYSGTDSTPNWGNGLRGLGWDGSSTTGGSVNSNITLHVEYLP